MSASRLSFQMTAVDVESLTRFSKRAKAENFLKILGRVAIDVELLLPASAIVGCKKQITKVLGLFVSDLQSN